ncbi:MAG: hypothetical protein N2247_10085 [Leptospiraceae bacterium]|jgi:uncharacterized membrane protein YgaE (UPF0421/DUF939 family)|nr:hypothetical protein [Leptospiraceae bacterium]
MEKNKNDINQNDTIKAIAESLNQFAGSLTGKNLENKLIEYSEVYGEIILYLYNQLENQKREIKHLKKELYRIESLLNQNSNHSTTKNYKKDKYLYIFNIILFIINIILMFLLLTK